MESQFWLENPNVLVESHSIWPTETMTSVEKYNSITRLMLILTVIGFVATKSYNILVVTLCFMVIVVYLHYANKKLFSGFSTQDPLSIIKGTTDVSTTNNPFCNVQYGVDPDKKPAPPAYDRAVKESIKQNVVDAIIKTNESNEDIQKVFADEEGEKQFDASLRNFYSMPNTEIPNDQKAFTDFCYGDLDNPVKDPENKNANEYETDQ